MRADTLRWRSPVPPSLMGEDNLVAITRTAMTALRPTWLKSTPNAEGDGAGLQVGQAKMTALISTNLLLVARFELLGLARP